MEWIVNVGRVVYPDSCVESIDMWIHTLRTGGSMRSLSENATSGFESRLNPRSCEVRPLTTAGSAKMSRAEPPT